MTALRNSHCPTQLVTARNGGTRPESRSERSPVMTSSQLDEQRPSMAADSPRRFAFIAAFIELPTTNCSQLVFTSPFEYHLLPLIFGGCRERERSSCFRAACESFKEARENQIQRWKTCNLQFKVSERIEFLAFSNFLKLNILFSSAGLWSRFLLGLPLIWCALLVTTVHFTRMKKCWEFI